ncbi:hypothetical protein BGX34_008340 [Mortierella sp. NVP85]|nr:hypothetical protein BGX34_008340 [Mortierella sp. NVP85]
MVFGSIVSSPLGSLSPQQTLQLANVYLDNACNMDDPDIALVLCHDTEVSLSQAKKAVRRTGDQGAIKDIAAVYVNLGNLLETRGYSNGAQTSYKKAVKLGGNHHHSGQSAKPSRPNSIVQSLKVAQPSTAEPEPSGPTTSASPETKETIGNIVMIPNHIFTENVPLPTVEFKLPEADERLNSTPQLVYCLSLLHLSRSTDDQLDHVAENWLQVIEKDTDEQERLLTMAIEVIRVFKRDEIKDAKAVAEVVCLSPVLNKDAFHDLLREFYSGIDHSGLLNFHHLEGLAQLIQGANTGHLSADDLVKTLDLLSKRLRDTHQQSTHHLYQLTLAVSHVLDAMADTKVTGLDRETLHEPLSNYLKELKNSSDPYLVYQAAYAYQALLCVPDNETAWQSALRRTEKVVRGVSGLVSAVKNLDLNKFIEGLEDIQKGMEGVSVVAEMVKSVYGDVTSLAQGGKGFLDSLKEGFSFERKRDWYSALRGTDTLIQGGEFATFRELVCRAPCRRDPAFQWGVCQRLGEIAVNSTWDIDTRQDAIAFLGEIYRSDEVWGQHASVKQWILNILMQLAAPSGTGLYCK